MARPPDIETAGAFPKADLRFDGRVAIVTGAGGNPGLGRSYALLLAERGAKVVVNNIASGVDGGGAQAVAAEICAAGGEAVAEGSSVADPAGAEAIVQAAADAWGRGDVRGNNPGVRHLA